MRKHIKKKINELFDSIKSLHYEVHISTDINIQHEYLTLCRNANKTILANSKNILDKYPDILELITVYDDCTNQLLDQNVIKLEELEYINNLVCVAQDLYKEVKEKYSMVFFPYKVSMWDSLESIYFACSEDVNCECFVVPIPYSTYDKSNDKWINCYEGDNFPSNIPVIHYSKYKLENILPDVVYIHNPYDEYNYVTRVHTDYFSGEIKKYCDKLVYVPYFVQPLKETSDNMLFPVYKNMDYMIAGSNSYKNSCKKYDFYNKIIPLGSPKLDRAINMCNKEKNIPNKFKEILEGKKVFMINTPLSTLLKEENLFNKLKSVFEIAKINRAAIIWRPHPLLENTIRSMSPHLLIKYEALIRYFNNNKVGIFDTSFDVTPMIALSDAYIGDLNSTLSSIFIATKKPILNLNYKIINSPRINYFTGLMFRDIIRLENKYIAFSSIVNAIFEVDLDFKNIKYLNSVPNQHKLHFSNLATYNNGNIYFNAYNINYLSAYNIDKNVFTILKEDNDILGYGNIISYKDKIIYLPGHNNKVSIYYINDDKFKYISCNKNKNYKNDLVAYFQNYAISENLLYLCAADSNEIYRFNMDSEILELFIAIGNTAFVDILIEDDKMWLSEVQKGQIIELNLHTKEYVCYENSKNLESWTATRAQTENSLNIVSHYLMKRGNMIYSTPAFSNCIVKLNLDTKETDTLLEDFFSYKLNEVKAKNNINCFFMLKLDSNEIVFQRIIDKKLIKFNFDTEEYEEYELRLSDEDIYKIESNKDFKLFKSINIMDNFINENYYYGVSEFIQEIENDTLQLPYNKIISNNLDGTCGEKTHQFIMNEIGDD